MAQDLYALFGVERPTAKAPVARGMDVATIDLATIVAHANVATRVASLAPAPTGVTVRRMVAVPGDANGTLKSLQQRLHRQVARKDARAFLVTFSVTFVGAMIFLL